MTQPEDQAESNPAEGIPDSFRLVVDRNTAPLAVVASFLQKLGNAFTKLTGKDHARIISSSYLLTDMEPEYAQNTETGDWDEVAARNMLALEEPVCTAYEVREAIFLLFPEETKQQAVLEEFHNRFPEKDWVKRYPAKATMQILMNALSES